MTAPEAIAVHFPGIVIDAIPPKPAAPFNVRGMRFSPSDFTTHGYTKGCQGCMNLQLGSQVRRPHREQCLKIIEECLMEIEVGRNRKDRESARHEEELTHKLQT